MAFAEFGLMLKNRGGLVFEDFLQLERLQQACLLAHPLFHFRAMRRSFGYRLHLRAKSGGPELQPYTFHSDRKRFR
jgi:hypothetical protein